MAHSPVKNQLNNSKIIIVSKNGELSILIPEKMIAFSTP